MNLQMTTAIYVRTNCTILCLIYSYVSNRRVEGLSDEQLRRELVRHGKVVGPITDTTRPLYNRQLKRSREEEQRGTAKRPRRGSSSSFDDPVQRARKNRHGLPRASAASRKQKQPGSVVPYTRHSDQHIKLSASPSSAEIWQRPSRNSPVPVVQNPFAVDESIDGPRDFGKGNSSAYVEPRGLSLFESFAEVTTAPIRRQAGIMSAMSSAMQMVGEGIHKVVNQIQEVVTPTKQSPKSSHRQRRSSFSPSRKQVPSPQKRVPSHYRQAIHLESVELGREVEICDESDSEDLHVSLEVPSPVPSAPPPPVYNSPITRYDWELNPTDVQICVRPDGSQWKLGKGGFGEVFKATKDGLDEVAVKVIRLYSSLAIEQFKQEIDMISKLRHRHILQFYGACVKPPCLYMVTELMQSDLFSVLRKDIRYLWTGLYGKNVMIGIASGLHYLHSRRPPIVHRDIKSPNILLMDGIAKIGDVGVARTKAQSDMTAQRGFTIAWAAPEVVYRRRATEKIDIWSFGIIYWEVVTGKMPGPGQLTLPLSTSTGIRNLYTSCTMEDPSLRPLASDILIILRTLE